MNITNNGDDVAVIERITINIQTTPIQEQKNQNAIPPRRYAVVLLNDDYTPMDFVVNILVQVFHKPTEEAINIMLKVHEQGKGLCGVYTKEIAETRVAQVKHLARQYEHPLRCQAQLI